MRYSDIRDQLQTGDVVLFSGRGFFSWLIQVFTNSNWSHVGMVVKLPEYDTVLLFESTTLSKTKGFFTGKTKEGVQLVSLSSRIKDYNGKVAIRHIYDTSDVTSEFVKFREEVNDREYEKNKFQLFKSAYDGWFGRNKTDLSSIFCSELVAEFWQRIKRISACVPSNEYTPDSFDGKIYLQNGKWVKLIEVEA